MESDLVMKSDLDREDIQVTKLGFRGHEC